MARKNSLSNLEIEPSIKKSCSLKSVVSHFLSHVFPTSNISNACNPNRGDRIRTCDLVLPKHPRYQAAPRPAKHHSNL